MLDCVLATEFSSDRKWNDPEPGRFRPIQIPESGSAALRLIACRCSALVGQHFWYVA